MLGHVNTNWHVEDTWGWMERIPKKSFWARFRTWAWEQGNLKDAEFAHLYSDIGRPSVSPAQLTSSRGTFPTASWRRRPCTMTG